MKRLNWNLMRKLLFEQYKTLVKKESLSDDEMNEIAELELYLDDIPDSCT